MALTKVSYGLITADASSADLNIDANTMFVDASTNRVGIGTQSPSGVLHVVGSNAIIDTADGSGLAINRPGNSAHLHLFPAYSSVPTIMGQGAGGLHLGYNSSTDGIRIDTSNNVGIGTDNPSQKLDVNGTVELNNLTVGGAQGSDGQVLTSTGSGVGWESVSAGPTHKTFGTSSIMVGDDSTGTINAANYNTGLGVDVFAALTSGDRNTAVGFAALDALTSGQFNTAVGDNALSTVSTGDNNTAIGRAALNANSTADNNTAVGNHAMLENSTGYDNVAVGRNSLDANTEGHSNTAVGESSLTTNTTGDRNVAIGQNAMSANSTGSENVAIGRNALDANTTADANTAVGDGALTACTTGNNNVCVGHGAGEAIDIGSGNVCIGSNAGDALNGSNGKWNTAVGFGALTSAGPRFQNTAVGQGCLSLNNAHGNTGVGAKCLEDNTSGSGLNGFGYFALNKVTTGDDNVAMGTSAGANITTGDNNICIGNSSGADALAGVTTANNQIILGNNSHTNFECKVSLTSGSDLRDKTDIKDLPTEAGLNFVKQMRPVTYVWDNRDKYYEYEEQAGGIKVLKAKHERDHSKKDTDKQVGFIAQEIKEIEKSIGWIDDHTVNTKNEDSYKLMYDQLIPILVKAIQELEEKVRVLEGR